LQEGQICESQPKNWMRYMMTSDEIVNGNTNR